MHSPLPVVSLVSGWGLWKMKNIVGLCGSLHCMAVRVCLLFHICYKINSHSVCTLFTLLCKHILVYFIKFTVLDLVGLSWRFAQFFVTPLFTASATEREVNAVNSENDKNLQNDTWRLNQLDKSTCKTGHPYTKFGTGELQKYRAVSTASFSVIKLARLCYRKQVLFSLVSVCVCVCVCVCVSLCVCLSKNWIALICHGEPRVNLSRWTPGVIKFW